MVQITTALIIAAAVIPALAAPLDLAAEQDFEAREPLRAANILGLHRGRTAGRSHRFRSFRKTLPTKAPAAEPAQERRSESDNLQELSARDPRFNFKGLGKVAKRVGNLSKGGVEFGSVAAPLSPHRHQPQQRRSDDLQLDIEERGLLGTAAKAAHAGQYHIGQAHPRDLEERGLLDHVRKPSAQDGLFHIQKAHRRDLEERGLLGIAAKAAHAGQYHIGQAHPRDIEERGLFDSVKKAAPRHFHIGRVHPRDIEEFDEFDQREPFRIPKFLTRHRIGQAAKGAAAVGAFSGTVATLNTQRELEFEEFDERDPKFRIGGIFKKIGHVASSFIREEDEGLTARSEEYFIRETPDIDELD